MAITITITSKSVIDYTQLQLQLSITPCLISVTFDSYAYELKLLFHFIV